MSEKFIVTATPPTTNGDLHIGHIAGPYLAADVFSRFQRSKGREVIYVSGADDHQSYVVTTSARLGRDPVELARECTERIRDTLGRAAIQVDAFPSPDCGHEKFVQSFFETLFHKNAFVAKTRDVWYCEQDGRYLFESYISGLCPTCSEPTKGGICESCGHPNDLTELLLPRCSVSDAHNLSKRKIKGLIFQLDSLRPQLKAFYETKRGVWRPHLLALLDELCAEPLTDYPITYPSSWGIQFPKPEFRDFVINVWAEMLPGLMHSTMVGKNLDGEAQNLWHRENGYKLVQFLGYDNSFFFAVVHLALLIASGHRWMLPDYIITNEFYLLDYYKFSTSQRHAIWARDMLEKVPCDQLRFYLCLSNPERYQTNFSEQEMRDVNRRMLLDPLGKLMFLASTLVRGKTPGLVDTNDTSEILRRTVSRYYKLLEDSFSPATFSLCEPARTLAAFISWLARYTEELRTAGAMDRTRQARCVADAAYGLLALIAFAGPIMPNFSRRLAKSAGVCWKGEWSPPASVSSMDVGALPRDPQVLFS